MEEKEHIKGLIDKYLDGKCTEREKFLIERFHLSQFVDNEIPKGEYSEAIKAQIWEKVTEASNQSPVRKISKAPFYWIAASITLFVALATCFLIFRTPFANKQLTVEKITPGGNKAILTLANGKKVVLNNAADGQMILQPGVQVTKTNGQLVYTITAAKDVIKPGAVYNIIETPAGGTYEVILADGTKVWLNSGSSIRYPLAFKASERTVELTGEGYFEVAHKTKQPFIVKARDHNVRVLGTHFNVNSYNDEPASKTTLIEGRVQVSNAQGIQLLWPGQQAIVNPGGINVTRPDIDQVMAWKNGDFQFDGESLRVIMRQISRWYNVEVVYQGNIGEARFGGSISRSKEISDVLKVLEVTDAVHFKIVGRRIMVMK